MAHTLLKHIVREAVHDRQQRALSDADHVTKRSGGSPTPGAGSHANHKTHTTPAGASEMTDVAKAATGICGPHEYND